jgi:RNA polymerase sigma-70 factor (ECF subfamily)
MGQTTSERQLIGRMQAGDSSAVGELASTYGPRIQQLAFRYVKNWEDAEEVTQDVLMKVYKKIDAFRGDAALSSWIYRITFNTAMSRLRSGRMARLSEVQPADNAAGDNPERVVDALKELPAVYRVPVILRDIQGLSTEEASAVLRVKPQTLKSRLHRGRLILRQHLSDFAGGVMLHAREASVN